MRLDPDNNKCLIALKKARRFEDIKEKGNNAIKNNNFDEAIKLYTEALEIDP